MERYRSPQSFTSAALSIGTPRPLRPYGQDENTTASSTPAIRQHALPRRSRVPLSRTPMFGERHELPADELGVLHPPENLDDAEISEQPNPAIPDVHTTGQSERGFMSSLRSGLRRVARTMEKHHSRQSLYEEYVAEAQAASLRNSQMSPSMNPPMQGIPESIEGDIYSTAEPQRGQSSQDTYDDGTTAVHHDWPRPVWPPINSPAYTISQLESENSKRVSSLGDLPPDDTWAYYYARIVHFLIWLHKLPWKDERIVNDYIPARDGRGGFGAERPKTNWYKPRQRKGADNEKGTSISPPAVLIVPATPQTGVSSNYFTYGVAPLPPAFIGQPIIRSPLSDSGATAIRPTHTPSTATSGGLPYMSPGMSSHGMGRHELTYSWYSGSPQQWPPYLSQFSSPQTRLGTEIYSPERR